MGEEKYCLKWNSYKNSVTSAFKNLRDNQEFVDVTLSAEGQNCQAHRVVLSASSPYFRDLLGGLQYWQHPVLLLRDVPHQDLLAVLEFVYVGQVNISQGQLQSFLRTAQYLQISGLVEDEATTNSNGEVRDGNKQVKRKVASETELARKIVKKDGEPKDDSVAGLALKAEPLEIGPTEFSCPFPTSHETGKGRGGGVPGGGGSQEGVSGAQGDDGRGSSPSPVAQGGSDGSVTCLVCRATLSNCNALYYHMNYVHSGGVEPLDILRKMNSSGPTDPGISVKQEHID